MRIDIEQGTLAQAVQKVGRAVAPHSPVPILSGILLEADGKGLTLTASSVTMTIRTELPAESGGFIDVTVREAGSIVLPAAYLDDIVRKIPAGTISIESDSRYVTKIKSGKSEFTLIGMDPEEFPVLPAFDTYDDIELPSDLLRQMIRQAAFAVSTSEARPVLTGVLWRLVDGRLKLAATDGVRLASRQASVDALSGRDYPELIIPGRSLQELSRLLKDQRELVRISATDNQMLFTDGRTHFYTGLLDGSYPNVDKIVPTSSTTVLTADTLALLGAIERVSLLAKDGHIVKLSLGEDQVIELTSVALDIGDGREELDAYSMSGPPVTVHFNAKYLTEALRTLDCDAVKLRFSGSMLPIVLEPADGTPALHLITPVRAHAS